MQNFDSSNFNLPPSIPTNLQSRVFSSSLFTLSTQPHINSISLPNNYECFHCNKTFKRKDHLKRHNLTHQIKGYYTCKCGKKFNRHDNYKNHLRTHTNVLSHVCMQLNCQKKFKNKAALDYHLLKHEKPKIVCNYPGCGKNFLRVNELKRHKKARKCHLKALFKNEMEKNQKKREEGETGKFNGVIHEIFKLRGKM